MGGAARLTTLASGILLFVVLLVATPKDLRASGEEIVALRVSYAANCVETVSAEVYCWGFNTSGVASPGEFFDHYQPPNLIGPLPPHTQLEVGGTAGCVVDLSSGLVCWGQKKLSPTSYVILGEPIPIPEYSSGVEALWIGELSTCIQTVDTSVKCGVSDEYNFQPVCLDPACSAHLTDPDSMSVGYHSCAVKDGGVKCWGRNESGQLGDGTTVDRAYALDVCETFTGSTCSQTLTDVASVDVGRTFTCAVKDTGSVYCWGEAEATGYVAGLTDATKVGVGFDFACVLRASAEVWCWGRNSKGERGDGTPVDVYFDPEPRKVVGIYDDIVDVRSEESHTCALGALGDVYCWGSNHLAEITLPPGGYFSTAQHISALTPDSDGDGVPDTVDGCPADAGTMTNHGCPFPPSVGGTTHIVMSAANQSSTQWWLVCLLAALVATVTGLLRLTRARARR